MASIRLKVLDRHSHGFRESDYDTAVDIQHVIYAEEAILFETEFGARFFACASDTNTSYSYLEPNFELLEAGGALVYEQHGDASRSSEESERSVDGIYIARETPRVPLAHFRLGLVAGHTNAFDVYEDESLPAEVRLGLAIHMANFDGRPNTASMHGGQDVSWLEHEFGQRQVHADVQDQDVSALTDCDAAVGSWVTVDLSQPFVDALEAAGRANVQTMQSNAEVRSANRATAACARVQHMIDEMAASASASVRSSFSPAGTIR